MQPKISIKLLSTCEFEEVIRHVKGGIVWHGILDLFLYASYYQYNCHFKASHQSYQ